MKNSSNYDAMKECDGYKTVTNTYIYAYIFIATQTDGLNIIISMYIFIPSYKNIHFINSVL